MSLAGGFSPGPAEGANGLFRSRFERSTERDNRDFDRRPRNELAEIRKVSARLKQGMRGVALGLGLLACVANCGADPASRNPTDPLDVQFVPFANHLGLTINGERRIVLGHEIDIWAFAGNPKDAAKQFEYVKNLGANTVTVVITWNDIEPSPGVFDSSKIDFAIEHAAKNGLMVVMGFDGVNTSGRISSPDGRVPIVPQDILKDNATYPRVTDPRENPRILFDPTANILRPEVDATRAREEHAFEMFMEFVAAADARAPHNPENSQAGKVIGIKIGNEYIVHYGVPLPYSDETFVDHAVESQRRLAEIAAKYPWPFLENFWVNQRGSDPNKHRARIPDILLGGDFYSELSGKSPTPDESKNFDDFVRHQLEIFISLTGPLIIPELDQVMDPALMAVALIGEFPVTYINRWSATASGHSGVDPPFDAYTGMRTPLGDEIYESNMAIRQIEKALVEAQGTARMNWFTSRTAQAGEIQLGKYKIAIRPNRGTKRGTSPKEALFAIDLGKEGILLSGRNLIASLDQKVGKGRADRVYLENGKIQIREGANVGPDGSVYFETQDAVLLH